MTEILALIIAMAIALSFFIGRAITERRMARAFSIFKAEVEEKQRRELVAALREIEEAKK